MAIRWLAGLRDRLQRDAQPVLQSQREFGIPFPGTGMDQGIPMALCARDSPGTAFSSPQQLAEHSKQPRGLTVGSGCFGCSDESGVWPCWDQGHRDSSCTAGAAQLHPHSPSNSPTRSPGTAPREGCSGTAHLEAAAPHCRARLSPQGWGDIASLRLCRTHGTRTQGYEPALNPSKKLPLGQPDLSKGCLPCLAEIISSTLFFLTLSNKTEETLRAKAIPQKKRTNHHSWRLKLGSSPNIHSVPWQEVSDFWLNQWVPKVLCSSRPFWVGLGTQEPPMPIPQQGHPVPWVI